MACMGSSPLQAIPAERYELEPVLIEITAECIYKPKPCGACGRGKGHPSHRRKGGTCVFVRRIGCATCGKPKNWSGHVGPPESFNAMAGRNPEVYRGAVRQWATVLGPLLRASDLPMGLGRVVVEGVVSFGDDHDRDQGNHRVIIEKALGDALVRGGYLVADTWKRYEFGDLQRADEPGVGRTRLMLFPTLEPEPPQVVLGA